MPDTSNFNAQAATDESSTPAASVWPDISGVPTTPVAPPGGMPVYPGDDIAGVPTTPVAPPGGMPVYPGDDIAGIPTTPIAPSGGMPVYPGPTWPDCPIYPLPTPTIPIITIPSVTYYGQVRFLNASTNGLSLDVYIDNQSVFSGSSFATVSTYTQVSDGFHTVTVRQTHGQVLYQQTLAFVSGEKVTMVLLDSSGGITLTKVSDMGCTNVPSGYGCLRVTNMTYSGSSYDVRLFNNQIVFAGIGYKDVTSFKQASAGNYTFFITNAQTSVTSFNELPVIIFTAIVGGCPACTVANPLLTYSINIRAGKAYTSYIIGNPWSNLYRVYTLED